MSLHRQKMSSITVLPMGTITYYDPCTSHDVKLTLKVLVATIDAQWEGMGDVESARYKPALLPPCPTIRVLRATITSKFSEIQHFKG